MAWGLFLFTILVSIIGPSVQQLQTLKDPEFVAPGGTVTMSCREAHSVDFLIMAWGLFLFTILVSIIGPSVQQLQTLKDPEFVAPGGTVTMSCRFDSGNIGDSNEPWWAQKKPGSRPRQIMYTTSTRPSDVPARFSGSRSGNSVDFLIMAWSLFLFTILVSIIGPSVQQLQTLKDPEFVAPGGTVTMSCRFNSGSIGPSIQQLQTLKETEFVAPGGTVTMSCRFDSGNIGDGNYPWWAQKKPGSRPRQIMYTTST
ncbi:immunoglobulin lambda-1 light chain-like [Podarcis lilfordi]|nr:immunoglobulin lambda-1 light chain-like [Podarcis lilfordi]